MLVRRPAVSHRRPRLPTAPATAACQRCSPSSPSRSGGPKVVREKRPALSLRRIYDSGGASRNRWKVRVLRNVNVPIIAPNLNDSVPTMACRRSLILSFLRRSVRKSKRMTLTPERTENARRNEPEYCQNAMSHLTRTQSTCRCQHDRTLGVRRVETLLVLVAPNEAATSTRHAIEELLATLLVALQCHQLVQRCEGNGTTDLIGSAWSATIRG